DVILLGPRIRYNLKHVEKDYPTMPVILMDMRLYAAMDGEAMVKQAQAALEK
ncbi:MAG: PTS sugar transporter subunit IIB, partial [Holdemania filiformis]